MDKGEEPMKYSSRADGVVRNIQHFEIARSDVEK